ncbi:MAG: ABC transporter permease [Patescibacteria group bacterium]|nr:ABC transporter permease [Patescibacteria group bacterium]
MIPFTIWKKELRGELYSWKSMLWLVIASLSFSLTSYLLLTNKELSLLDQTELMWLLSKVIVGIGLLVTALDAASILTVEFDKDTAENLFLAPVSLVNLILGKFLAVLTLWGAVFLVSVPYIIVTSAGSGLAIPFLTHVALLGTLGASAFTLLILGLSLLFRSGKNTITTSLIVLLALGIPATFTSTLKNDPVSQLISHINPLDAIFSSLDNVLVDYHTSILQNWQFLLPLVIFLVLSLGFLYGSSRIFMRQGVVKND